MKARIPKEFDAIEFVKDRHNAFARAVMDNDWNGVIKYMKKYKMPVPKDRLVLKIAIYKAVQECTDMPEDVKKTAYDKCVKLGYNPFVNWDEEYEAEKDE